MKNYLRFERGEEPGQLVPVCTCGRASLSHQEECKECGLKIPTPPSPEYMIRETIKAIEGGQFDYINSNFTQSFGALFLKKLKESIGEK